MSTRESSTIDSGDRPRHTFSFFSFTPVGLLKMRTGVKEEKRFKLTPLVAAICLLTWMRVAQAAPPAPPVSVFAADVPYDSGESLRVAVAMEEAKLGNDPIRIVIQKCLEERGVYTEVATVSEVAEEPGGIAGLIRSLGSPPPWVYYIAKVDGVATDKPVWFRAYAVNNDGENSTYTSVKTPAVPSRQFFDGNRLWFFVVTLFVCGTVIAFILIARSGIPMWIRKISALDAMDEAVGRATEMGKSCLFVTGVVDLNEIETIAGITVLSRVAEKAAEYDATVVVPTSRSLVMTAARETSQAAYLAAGRPDAYQEDRIYYVTDDQFGFVAHLSGYMMREKPAACFYMGQFYAESLLLGETGNTIGAIQIAGTAQPAQLPFFVAACDYTLIGEEFFAASAYLSRDPDQLGSLKGQDVGKLLVMSIIFIGVSLLTIVSVTKSGTAVHDLAKAAADYLQNQMLKSS
jgi:hypothetical protein